MSGSGTEIAKAGGGAAGAAALMMVSFDRQET
jgi:hypothetical protein